MKIEIDKKKSAEVLSGFMHSAVDLGKKAVAEAKSGVDAMVEKSKSDSYARRLKKLNPLFPEQYQSDSFHLPNVIMIVDDAVRRGIDVCEGAIGWLSNEGNVEVLHLYDEAVAFSGIQFLPTATCDTVYYVDAFDRNRFIRADCVFSRAHEERIAELQHIAHSIGAKRCYIEVTEATSDMQSQRKSAKLSSGKLGASAEQEFTSHNTAQQSGRIEAVFKGFRRPQRPTLKWFAHDNNINNLIDMCCNGKRTVKDQTLELAGSSSATMSQKIAAAIDGLSGGAKGSISVSSQAAKEQRSTLRFHVEF